MNFDKLKKAAESTKKIAVKKILDGAGAIGDKLNSYAEEEPESLDELDTSAACEKEKQSIDVEAMLDRFREKKEDLGNTLRGFFTDSRDDAGQEETEEDEPESESCDETEENEPESESCDEAVIESKDDTAEECDESVSETESETVIVKKEITVDNSDLKDDINKLTDCININREEFTDRYNDIVNRISEMDERITKISDMFDAKYDSLAGISKNINGKINVTDEKMKEVVNSLGSVSKLNDSIFDLKNSQMNMKKAVAELDLSFNKLKKKMNHSVAIISVLTAIIVLLEVFNLLS